MSGGKLNRAALQGTGVDKLHIDELKKTVRLLQDIECITPFSAATHCFLTDIVQEVQNQMHCVSETTIPAVQNSRAEISVDLPVIDGTQVRCYVQKWGDKWTGHIVVETIRGQDDLKTIVDRRELFAFDSSSLPMGPWLKDTCHRVDTLMIYKILPHYIERFPEVSKKEGYSFGGALSKSINQQILDPAWEETKFALYTLMKSGVMKDYLETVGNIASTLDYLKELGFDEEKINALRDSIDCEEDLERE